jgi:hypothetical protein
MRSQNRTTVACLVAIAGLLVGCSKKEAETTPRSESAPDASAAATAPAAAAPAPTAAAPTQEAEVIPGQNAVRSALKAKNYSGAVTQLLGMRQGLPAEMFETYAGFYGEVRNTLIEAAQTDPNAAQALALLRASTSGR